MSSKTNREAAFEVKRLAAPFTLEKLAEGETEGKVKGEGMVFDVPHPTSSWRLPPDWWDVLRPGSFTDTLAAHEKNGTMPLMQFMHERANIPGVWTSAKQTAKSLKLEGLVSKNAGTPSGVPLLELLHMKAITGLSIGFAPTIVELDEKKKTRFINSVDLTEVSFVDIPGASRARVTDVKRDKRSLEEILRSVGLSQREAKALIAAGFDAMIGDDESDPPSSARPTKENKDSPDETPGNVQRDAEPSGIAKSISDLAKLIRSA